jgi:hypothetical protein
LRLHKVKGGTTELIIDESTTDEDLYQFLRKFINESSFSELQIEYINDSDENKIDVSFDKKKVKNILLMQNANGGRFSTKYFIDMNINDIVKKLTKLTLE